tara:strand:- start:105 stop:689 length:585 start_codon:yes stop_codon:yes gene_type:complete
MEYTNEEILFIQVKKPEFRVKPVLSLDAVIVEFLKKYEVFVQPTTSATRNTGESAVAGAITGMAGADVGGDAFMISGQNKQTRVQEWTQWKQWALDHKDFEDFRFEKIDNAKKHNEEIAQKLKDPAIQKQLEPVMEEFRKEKENERKIVLVGIPIFLMIFVGIPLIVNFVETRNDDSSFNNSIIRSEKVAKFIS